MRPTISVLTILFNGLNVLPKGMLRANLTQLLPHVDDVWVVEGAVELSRDFSPDGKSTDGTREFLADMAKEFPQIHVILNGGQYWSSKTVMCNAPMDQIKSEYVWQVDSDEFYLEDDIPKILALLKGRPDRVDFYANHFWGSAGHVMDETQVQWANHLPWMRLFRREEGSFWASHAPPDMRYKGNIPGLKIINRDETLAQGIRLQHFGYVSPAQVAFKARYFGAGDQYITNMWKWRRDHGHKVFGDTTREYKGPWPSCLEGIVW